MHTSEPGRTHTTLDPPREMSNDARSWVSLDVKTSLKSEIPQRLLLMVSSTRKAVVVTQTLEDLLRENEGYLNWLDSIGAEQAKQDFVLSLQGALISPAPPAAPFGAYYYQPPVVLPPTFEVEVPWLADVDDVSMSPYTHRSKNFSSAADPVNLIFSGNAYVDTVAEIFMHHLFPPWLDTTAPIVGKCAEKHYAFVGSEWREMKHSLALGGCALNRCHVRLFDGGHTQQLGKLTVGNVHYEHWDWLKRHVVEDWDNSQNFVRQLFESKPYCKRVLEKPLQKEQEMQRVVHDGIATMIQLD